MSFKCSLQDIDRSQSKLMDYLSFLSCLPTCYCLLSSSLLMRLSLLNTIIYIPNPPLPAQDVSILSLTAPDCSGVQVRAHCSEINTWPYNKDVDQNYLIVFTLSSLPCQQWPQRAQQPIYHHTIYISKREITLPLRDGSFHSPLLFLLD